MQQVKVFCTNVMDTHTAFAVRADNGDEVFIPSAVAHAVKLQPADTVIAHIVPNTRHPEKTPWFAISIERDVEQGAIDEKILAHLDGVAYASTSEIVQEFSTDATTASNALNRLFRRGKLAKAEVYSRPGQERATTCLWATEASRFTDYDE